MSVTLTGSGGLFKRFGLIAGGLADLKSLMGGTATTPVTSGASWLTRGVNLETDGLNSPAVSIELDGVWTAISTWRSSQSSLFSSMRSYAEKMFIRQVTLDATLSSQDLTSALREIISQMRTNSDSINASTVSAGSQTNVGSPTGNAVIVSSVKNKEGYIWQTPYAETLRFTVTGDAQTGSTARFEPVTIRGASAINDKFAYDWPGGSGVTVQVNLIDAQNDNSRGNALVNSDFETATTANYPDNWIVQLGAAGTDFLRAAAGYTQTYALQIVGDGSTLAAIAQEFDHATSTSAGSGGTPFELEPLTQYAIQFWSKVSASATGVLQVALVDSSGNVINDAAGTANSFTVNLASLSTTYASSTGVFRTPAVLPSDGIVRLRLKATTAIQSSRSLYIDDIGFSKMTSVYKGGPSVAIFAASTNVATNDAWTVAISNSLGKTAKWLEILFNLNDKELIIPYSGSPTVADSVIA